MSDSLGPDRNEHSVNPDRDPNNFQRLSSESKIHHKQGKSQRATIGNKP